MPDPTSSIGFNRYAYVNNNPINFTDPSGHLQCDDGDADGVCDNNGGNGGGGGGNGGEDIPPFIPLDENGGSGNNTNNSIIDHFVQVWRYIVTTMAIFNDPDLGEIIMNQKTTLIDLGLWQTGSITSSTSVTTYNTIFSVWSDEGIEFSFPKGLSKIHFSRTGFQTTLRISPLISQQPLNKGDKQRVYYSYSVGVDLTEGAAGSVITSLRYNQNTLTKSGLSITNSSGLYFSSKIAEGSAAVAVVATALIGAPSLSPIITQLLLRLRQTLPNLR